MKGGYMESAIRLAQAEDVSAMVELSEQQRRLDQERYHLKFYHKAADSREKQLPYFQRQVADERVIALVHEPNGSIDGFIIGMLIDAPPVYDPGGLTCLVDDFVVQQPEAWSQIGAALLRQVNQLAKEQGAVQTVVVCRRLDEDKRTTLASLGLTVVSEWSVVEL
jgi:GNAT superfamily N-acetyltransferase